MKTLLHILFAVGMAMVFTGNIMAEDTLSGTVYYAGDGTAVSGIEVYYHNLETDDSGGGSNTDSSGYYGSGITRYGATRVTVCPSVSSGYAYAFRNINLVSGSSLSNYNLRLLQGAKVSGTISGYSEKYVNIDGNKGMAWAQTDVSGNYEMRVAPGEYLLSIECPDPGSTGLVAMPVSVTVTSPTDDKTPTITTYDTSNTANIGRIYGDVTIGFFPTSGNPVVIAFKKDALKNVTIDNMQNLIPIAMSGVSSSPPYPYELRVPPGQEFDICLVIMNESGSITSVTPRYVSLGYTAPGAGGAQQNNITVSGTAGGTIQGTVKFEGALAAGAKVALYDQFGAFKGMADTGNDGAYKFYNVIAGNYTVRAVMPYTGGVKSGARPVTVTESGTVTADIMNITPDQPENYFNAASLICPGGEDLIYNFGTSAGYWAYENNSTWKQVQYTAVSGLTFTASADLDGNGAKDLLFNFGTDAGKGFWAFENNSTWKKIDYTDTTGVTFKSASDLDGNGAKDLVFDFGSSVGFWAYENNSTWKKIDYTDTTGVDLKTAADLDGNGSQDLVFDFGETAGYWAYENNSTWAQIPYTSVSGLTLQAATDLDGNGSKDLVFNFGTSAGQGFWAYENNTTWKKIDYTDTTGVTLMASADLDGNGSKDLVVDFGVSAGYWFFANNSTWMQIQYTNVSGITLQTVADVDGNGKQDLVFNFGTDPGKGYWIFANSTTWMQVQYTDAAGVTLKAATDLDGNGQKDLVFDFGSSSGYWAFTNNSTWTQIPYTNVSGLTLEAVTDLDGNGSKDLVFNFGTDAGKGYWAFENASTWKKIDYTDTTGITTPQGDTDAIARMDFESGLNPQSSASYYRMKGDMVIAPTIPK